MLLGHVSTLILDKSAFEMLNKDEHLECSCRYRLNVLPVLVREISSDVVRRDPSLKVSPERRVQVLAARFFGSGDPPNVPFPMLCVASLAGRPVTMKGRPIWDGGQYLKDDGTGGSAVFFDLTPTNRKIMRMADGRFVPQDRADAVADHLRNATFSVGALEGRLRGRLRRPKSVDQIALVVDELLSDHDVQFEILEWLLEQLRLPQEACAVIRGRWLQAGRPPLNEFAPYASFCGRTMLMLVVGMKHKVLTNRPTNRVDIEYLFYAPFCQVFVSGDKLHAQLAPLVLRSDQRFRLGREFKAELKRQWSESQARGAGRSPAT